MIEIHPSAVVDPQAQIGQDVKIGPFCVVHANVTIGDRCRLATHVVIRDGVIMGADNEMHESAVIGGRPQHLNAGQLVGGVSIGSGNTFREHTTIHCALEPGVQTMVGDNNFVMVNAHIAHDCIVGNHIVLVNNVMLGGHVTVEDRAYISGGVGIHQFCRVGKYAMVAGVGRITRDVPPYVVVDGEKRGVMGLNIVGLRRNGFSQYDIAQLKAAYRIIYRSELSWGAILEELASTFQLGPATAFHEFFMHGQRGYLPNREDAATTLSVIRDRHDDEGRVGKAA